MVRSIVQALRYNENAPGDFDNEAWDRPQTVRSLQRKLAETHRSATVAADNRAADNRATLAFLSRFIVLQAIGVAAFAGFWIAGIAGKPFESRSAPMCFIILSVGALGMLCVVLRRWRDVQWIATHVVRIGLLGTVIGLIIAFSHAAVAAGNPEDIKPIISAVVGGMYVSLYATLFGIGTNLWLKINLRLLGDHG